MYACLTYLVKANIVIVVMAIFYYWGLRGLTFYHLNRVYFILGTILALIVPLMNPLPIITHSHQLMHKANLVAINWSQLQLIGRGTARFDYETLLLYIYVFVALIFLSRFLIQFISVARIHQGSARARFRGIGFRNTDLNIGPFSFVNQIYCNADAYTDEQLETILKHEQIHVKQYHFADVLISEICIVLFWFNPFVWLTSRCMKENLEFITDRTILNNGVHYKTYQYNLLNISTASNLLNVVQNFNHLTIKKRILMMNRAKSSRMQAGKYLVFIVGIVVFSFFINVSQAQLNKLNSTQIYHVDTLKALQPDDEKYYKKLGLNIAADQDHPHLDAPKKTSNLAGQNSLHTAKDELFQFVPKVDSTDDHSLIIGHASNKITYFIDGVRASNYDKVKKEDVYKIQVLAGTDAKKIFNDIDADEVIIITTKPNINSKAVQELNRRLSGQNK